MKKASSKTSFVPEYMRLRRYVMSQVARGADSAKLLSVREMAKLYGVSVSTVVKAQEQLLAEGALISKQGVGTFVNPHYGLRSGLGCVGVIVGAGLLVHLDPVYMKILSGIFDVLSGAKLTAQILHSGNRGDAFAKEIRLLRLDGVIWINPEKNEIAALEKNGVRTISVDLADRETARCSISADLYDEGYRLANYLLELGRRRLVWTTRGPVPAENRELALRGFADAHREHGAEMDKRLICPVDDAAKRLEALIDLDIPFDAVSANSQIYLDALEILKAKGLRVPEDVSVITEDDYLTMDMSDPVPTRIARPLRELGETAARAMIDLINGDRRGPFSIPLAWQIIPGETCAAPKNNVKETREVLA